MNETCQGCDETLLRSECTTYLVTYTDGVLDRVRYCGDCAEAAARGDTGIIRTLERIPEGAQA
jgi:hypothetical protein